VAGAPWSRFLTFALAQAHVSPMKSSVVGTIWLSMNFANVRSSDSDCLLGAMEAVSPIFSAIAIRLVSANLLMLEYEICKGVLQDFVRGRGMEGGSDVSHQGGHDVRQPRRTCVVSSRDVFGALAVLLRLAKTLTQPRSHLGTVLQTLDLTFG